MSTNMKPRILKHGKILREKYLDMIGGTTWARQSNGVLALYSVFELTSRIRYQRAFVDFFEDELVLNGYNWRQVLDNYLFKGKEPLVNCLVAGRMIDTPNIGSR